MTKKQGFSLNRVPKVPSLGKMNYGTGKSMDVFGGLHYDAKKVKRVI